MRTERWWWLLAFLAVSLAIHLFIGATSRRLPGVPLAVSKPAEIEVELQPEKPEALPKPKPQPKTPAPKPEKVREKSTPKQAAAKPTAPRAPRASHPALRPARLAEAKPAPERRIRTDEPRPRQEKSDPGGLDPKREEKPLPLGSPAAPRPLPRMARALPAEQPRERAALPAPRSQPELPRPDADPGKLDLKPRRMAGAPSLNVENPLGTGPAGPESRPEFSGANGQGVGPRLSRQRPRMLAGGGSPSQGPVPGSRDGLRAPEQPDDGLLFNGGGAGGTRLPRTPAKIGGGGGASVLSVKNPLAPDRIAEELPGLGPGAGGGAGAGAGGGNGSGRGNGVGTDPNGRLALSTLRAKPGPGLGVGKGSGIGTAPPGGGRGAGSDQPGTGGTGLGYGRGGGLGIGDGTGPGIGGGSGGRRIARGGGNGDGGSGGGGGGGRMALNRGIPFGDITGLLRGDPGGGGGRGGGPGGPGRGRLPGREGGGGSRAVHIVYVLDTSGSMEQGNKIGKAREALKKALAELKPGDSFNIVGFDGQVRAFGGSMIAASRENVTRGMEWVDAIRTAPGTFISGAMEKALQAEQVTHVFLLSDGEPSRGITNPAQLRALIKERNTGKAVIATLALGLGEEFPGIPLLKGIAEDNGGEFSYVNLAR